MPCDFVGYKLMLYKNVHNYVKLAIFLYSILASAYPEAHFKIFTAPDIHAFVVCAQLIEIFFVNREQSTGHSRCS